MKYCTPLISLSLLLLFASCEEPVTGNRLDMTLTSDSQVTSVDMKPEGGQEADEGTGQEVDQEVVDECASLGSCSAAGGWCEPSAHPECWAGGAPVCYEADHSLSQRYCADTPATGTHGCECPEGYKVSPDGDACVRAETVDAIQNGAALSVCAAEDNFNYSKFGALYPNTDGNGSNDYQQSDYWGSDNGQNNGRLNQVGVWACEVGNSGSTSHEPIEEWIGFSHCLVVEEAGDYLLGIAGDNRVRLKVDGELVFERDSEDTSNFSYWHINKVSLTSGVHFIELYGLNDHQVAAFGAEISGPFAEGSLLTEEAMKAADYAGNIIFSTEQLIDQGVFNLGSESGWQCPEGGYALNTCGEAPICTKLDTIACETPVDPPAPEVDCDQVGRCAPNGSWCESARHPECWAGDAPICWDPSHPISIRHCGEDLEDDSFCVCPEGFSIKPDGDGCIRVSESEATFNGTRYQVCDADGSSAYGWGGALYQNTDGNPTNDNLVSEYWGSTGASDAVNGRLNQIGIWACDPTSSQVGTNPVNEWIGFSHCLAVEEAGDYLIGIAGDNRVRFKVNGTLMFELDNDQTRNFNYWHMRKISLTSGVNFIELSGLNDGLIAAFGAEISGPFAPGSIDTEDAQKQADYAGNIIFSTGNLEGEVFDVGESSGWSCPDGSALNTCVDSPTCSTIETAECVNVTSPVNECKEDPNLCGDIAICVDTEEGYDCICPPGYEGDGSSCTPVICPEFASGAPDCSCDPGYVGLLTFDYENNVWLGTCVAADPCDEIICPEDQYCDPSTQGCVSCLRESSCINGSYCEAADEPSCWSGDAPVCYEPSHPLSQRYCQEDDLPTACECPEGFVASPGQDSCIRVNSEPAIFHGTEYQVCDANGNRGYGWAGALYEDTDGDNSNNAVVDPYWGQQGSSSLGRLNQVGIWTCLPDQPNTVGTDPIDEWIGFSHCLSVDRAGDYLIGIAGDNRVRFSVNGQIVFERDDEETTNFNYWHIRKVSLQSGLNIIELSGYNDHAVAAFGAEISGPFTPGSLETEAAQKAADYAGNIIFSTSRMEGRLFDIGSSSGWSCPGETQALNTCMDEPECSEIERVDCLNEAPDCSEAFECVNGAYCETGRNPLCWQGELPVCYPTDHPLSVRHCPDPVDCSQSYECVNGAYCELENTPECWSGDGPVCYPPEAPISLEHCAVDPCDGVICGRGELCDPSNGECVDCSTAYECVNGSYCEAGDNPICWAGDAPVCFEDSHPLSQYYCQQPDACVCPDGFSPTPNQEVCVQSTAVEAINNATRYEVCPATNSTAYGWGGALFMDTDGDPTNNRVINDFFTQRLDNVGIWACDAAQGNVGTLPVHEWIGFSRCIDIAVGGDYLIGIAGDNQVRLKVNGQLVFERTGGDTGNFNYWHIIKLSLNSGVNVIELSGRNNGNIAAFGAEISGPFPAGSLETEAQQMLADYAGNIIFSTGDMEGEIFDIGENSGWSCPNDEYALNLCAPEPQCTLTTYAECEDAQVDECADGTDECDANATCTDESNGYSCVCNQGYVGSGFVCDLAPCPENASGAPNCICDEGFAGRLNFDPVNGWQGTCVEVDLCEGVFCQVGHACDPDTGNCVSCDRSYECVEGQYCEIGDRPECWQGDQPVCYGVDHPLSIQNCPQTPTCNCPRGYSPTPANDACVSTLNAPAENNAVNYDVCDAAGSTAYGWAGALYVDTDGDDSNNVVNDPYWGVTNSTTEGRLNTVGIWACDSRSGVVGTLPIDEWIGFSHCLDIAVGGDYLIGIAGDNRVRFRVDGVMTFELDTDLTRNFNYWHVQKISLTSGIHVIELLGRNDGNVAAFGAEISGPFPMGSLDDELSQQQADYANNIIFTTEDMVGQTFDIGENSGWTCPEGQTLNTCQQPPSCTSIQYTDCIER